jgi:glyoxylase-like metal-dependent hydrolase (beta-lactamase superfamily II)
MTPAVSTHPISWQLVSDGEAGYPPDLILPEADPDVLRAAGIEEQLITPYQPLLVRAHGRTILVDAGIGPDIAAAMGAPAGRLVAELRAAGVEPADVDDVIVTHAHPDHAGGLTTAGAPTFARARHHVARAERDFWLGPDPGARLFPPMADVMVSTATAALETLERAGLVDLREAGDEVAPGVTVLDAPGHTPGHMAVEVDDGGDGLLYLADAVVHELQLEHADWTAPLDTDAAATVATRRALLDRAAERGTIVAGFHLRSTGRVAREGDGYRLAPAG